MRPRSYYAICAIGLLFLIGGEAPAQEKTAEAKLPLHDRVWIAAQIYSAINVYFGHWRGVPELNLDQEFQSYLDEIIATDDRRSFDLASMELVAKLMNGHTGFRDRWLTDNYGQSLGFYAYSVGGSWVVTQSMVDELKPGDVISRINDQSSEEFFGSVRKYISASNERSARRFLFEYPYLFPASFSLVLKDGRDVRVTRKGWPEKEHFELTVRENNGTLYMRIPSFADPKLEEAAVRAVQEFSNSKAIVVDVRGNHGGSSPETLIGKLMNRRYRWWTQSTSVDFGLLKFQGIFGEHSDVFSYGVRQSRTRALIKVRFSFLWMADDSQPARIFSFHSRTTIARSFWARRLVAVPGNRSRSSSEMACFCRSVPAEFRFLMVRNLREWASSRRLRLT